MKEVNKATITVIIIIASLALISLVSSNIEEIKITTCDCLEHTDCAIMQECVIEEGEICGVCEELKMSGDGSPGPKQ